MNKPNLIQSNKAMKGRINGQKMIFAKSLDPKDREIETNLKQTKLEIEEIKLFDEFNP